MPNGEGNCDKNERRIIWTSNKIEWRKVRTPPHRLSLAAVTNIARLIGHTATAAAREKSQNFARWSTDSYVGFNIQNLQGAIKVSRRRAGDALPARTQAADKVRPAERAATVTTRRESPYPAQFSTGSYVGISIEDPLGARGVSGRSPRDVRPWRGDRSDTPSGRDDLVAPNCCLVRFSSFGKQISQQLMQPQPLGFGRESGVGATMSGREHPTNTSKRSSHAFKCPKEGRYHMGGEDTRGATTV